MDITQPDDLRLALRLAGVSPKKGLGQHFLIDKPSLAAMVEAGELTKQDTALEIGPGLGVMTGLLVKAAAKVIAVETDAVFAELLRREAPPNLEVVEADIMDFDLRQLPTGYKVVANLPYYLTSAILRLLMESANPPALAALLVQKEVAERVAAGPGEYSILALSVQYYAEAEVSLTVERHKFWPPPKVDSAILQLKRRPRPLFEADTTKLFRLIKGGFSERRKQLKNSLAGSLNADVSLITKLLAAAKIPPQARAQELDWSAWERLYKEAIKRELI